jgi:dihydrofolate reductase
MRKLVVFNSVSLDGYFSGTNGDLSWAHRAPKDAEFDKFVEGNAKGGGVLVFGRKTYELMVSYWPTPQALENDPVVAKRMNQMPKVVFSRTLDEASWSNTRLVKGDPAAEMRRLKSESGEDMAIMGSGSIIPQLTQEGLIDEFQMVVVPVVLGKGRTMFDGVKKEVALKLTKTRAFGNGNLFMSYEPMA